MAYQTGFKTTLAIKLNAGDTTMTVATAPTITAGRVFLDNGAQQERIRFTGVSGSVLTGLTRNLSKTADPITGGTGLQWIAGTQIKIVAMHDQLWDKSTFLADEHTYTAKQTFEDIEVTGTADFSAIGDLNVLGKSNPCPVVASELARDAMYPSPATNDRVYRTDLNAEQIYNGGTAAWETVGIGTSVVDATTLVKGIVLLALTSAGATDEDKVPVLDALGQIANGFVGSLGTFVFGGGEDGDVTISTDTTITRDMYYNDLTINDTKTLYPNGYRIFVKGTLTNNGTISNNGNNGSNGGTASGTGAGGAGGAVVNNGTLNAGVAGVSGQATENRYGGSDTRTVLTPSSYVTYSSNNGANGGASAVGSWTVTGGVSNRGINYNKLYNFESMLFTMLGMGSYTPLQYKISGQAMGGGGTGEDTGSGHNLGSGGGGGSSGGLIWISANTFNNAGVITAIGGNGGNGGAGEAEYGGGGGGGGHGGFLFLVRHTLTDIGTVTLTGGTGGTASNGGTAGDNGSDGSTIQITV